MQPMSFARAIALLGIGSFAFYQRQGKTQQSGAGNGRGAANLGRVLRKWHEIGSERGAWSAPPRTGGDKIVRNSTKRNLPLAAGPRVGHIGLNGAVAEWLKAAVC